jgi:hypothetical protein
LQRRRPTPAASEGHTTASEGNLFNSDMNINALDDNAGLRYIYTVKEVA